MGTLRSVGICVAIRFRISRPWGGGSPGQRKTCLRWGGGVPRCKARQHRRVAPRSRELPTVPGRPSTRAGCGPEASCRAGRGPRTGGPSGGGRPGTAGSPILTVRSPRGARNVSWDRTTCQTGGRSRVHGPATAGCLATTAGHLGSPPRWAPLRWGPWGPPTGARPPGDSQAGPPRVGRGPSPWVPPGCFAGMHAPRGPTGEPRLAGGGKMCSLQGFRRQDPHGECGSRGPHPNPSDRPPVAALGGPLCPVHRPQGRLSRGRGRVLPLVGPAGGRKRPAAEGRPSEEGRVLVLEVGSNRGTPCLLSGFPGLLPRGRVSACLCAARRSAPGSWAGGAPCCGGGGPSWPRQTQRQAGVRPGPAALGFGSPEGRPMVFTVGPALGPCPQGGTPAGLRGGTTSWGRGRTGPSTTGTLARTTPGRRPASGSPPVLPSPAPRRGGGTGGSPTVHPRSCCPMPRRTRPAPWSRRPRSCGWWAWRRLRGRGLYPSDRTPPVPGRAGTRSPPHPSLESAGPGWPPRPRKTGGKPPFR